MDTYCESNDELINRAAAAGFPIVHQDIVRTLRARLIPAPRQLAHGRARGTTVRYRAGTADQLVLVLRLREGRRRPLAYLRWCTWWNGGTIDERWIRAELRQAAERGVRDRAAMLAAADTSEAGDEARAEVEQRSAKALRAMASAARGPFRMLASPSLLTLVLQLLEGTPPDAVSLRDTFGDIGVEPIAPAEADLLLACSEAFRQADLVEWAASAPMAALQSLRDELRVLAEALFRAGPDVEGLAPRRARMLLEIHAAFKHLIASPDVLLMWMLLRSTRQAGGVLLAWLRKTVMERGLLGTGA